MKLHKIERIEPRKRNVTISKSNTSKTVYFKCNLIETIVVDVSAKKNQTKSNNPSKV